MSAVILLFLVFWVFCCFVVVLLLLMLLLVNGEKKYSLKLTETIKLTEFANIHVKLGFEKVTLFNLVSLMAHSSF